MTPPGGEERITRGPSAPQGSRRRLRAVETARIQPPQRSQEYPPGNLPIELSSFVGRERELAEVKRLLLDGAHLLTLTGAGGCGKTRLALRVAGDLVEHFEDGVWLVELASLSEATLVPLAVASTLLVREQPGRPLTETLVDHLKSKKLMLVLDNCEHLVEACAALASVLLRACPELRILATSREALYITGEISCSVPPLSLPDHQRSPASPEELNQYGAVRLFTERAKAMLPTFALTERNAAVVTRVCKRLDGMPLAIELAASRARVLSVEQIAERLDDCFRLLKGGDRAALPRHQTLRATIDWSHELLSEEEQTLFRRLSVFAGGFSLVAVEEICSGEGVEREEVLDVLSHLVDKSLIVVAEHNGEARYRILETVRQYGREKLAASREAAAIKRRHASFFLKLAETAEVAMLGPAQVAWVAQLEAEHDNLRAVLDWGQEGPGAAETGLRLAGALSMFWVIGSYFTEAITRLQRLLALPAASAHSPARAKACRILGMLHFRHADHDAGDYLKARAAYEEALTIFRELENAEQIANMLTDLGRLDTELGAYASGRSLLEESLTLQRRLGNEHGMALALQSLGWLEFLQGEHASARPHLEESLEILRRLSDKFYLGGSVLYLGCLDCEQGNLAAARRRFAEAARLVPFQRYRYVAPVVLEGFVVLTAAQRQAARAVRLAGAAAELHRVMGAQFRLSWHQYVERQLESVRQTLSREEGTAAWEEGQAMTLEEALAYALDEPALQEGGARLSAAGEPPAEEAHPETTYPHGLTAREAEVLGLLAAGKTNKEIAAALFLSVSTVQRHIANIYAKIGAHGRAEATAYALARGIVRPPDRPLES